MSQPLHTTKTLRRDEDAVGEWTIRVSDQNAEGHNGTFLGWSMTFWGSTVDATKAKVYELLNEDDSPLPPDPKPPSSTIPMNTKTHPKPTAHLPGDHGDADGEAYKPAFPTEHDTTSPTMTPTPDEGWFPGLSKLESNQKWFFGAISAVVIFGLIAGVFFWRRRIAARRRVNYTSLTSDDLAMNSVSRDGRPSGGARTKELYDAFGELSDDEDADEETGLRPRDHDGSPGGRLAFHSGFLDDEDPVSAGHRSTYRDEPEEADHLKGPTDVRSASPASGSGGEGSGDGSWEHASQTR